MKKWYILLISFVAALVLFMTLAVFYDSASKDNTPPEGTVAIILKSTVGPTMDFWSVVVQGIQDAGREFDVEYEVYGPRYEKEINRQINILQSVIQKRPSLIILAAADYIRLVDSVAQAAALGIPVITLDSGIQSDIPVSFVATDNLEAGQKAGEEMKRLIEKHDRKKIVIMSHIAETATAIDREKGVRSVLDEEDIVGTWFCDADEDISYRITEELLKIPDLGGIIGLNEMASLGVARAVKDHGLRGEVLVVAFDNAVQELSLLEEGVIQATVVQRPYNMGYLSVKAAADFLKGKTVDPLMDTGSVLITKENMFERQYQELLFPVAGIKK